MATGARRTAPAITIELEPSPAFMPRIVSAAIALEQIKREAAQRLSQTAFGVLRNWEGGELLQ
jgi:hypothetical protein